MESVSLNRKRRKPVVRAASEPIENDKTGKAKYGAQDGLSFEDIRVHYVASYPVGRGTIGSGRDGGVSGKAAVQMMMRAGGGQAAAPAEGGEVVHVTPRDLYAFGNRAHPREARPRQDFGVGSEEEEVGPERPPLPRGASTFSDVDEAPLTGHYHKLAGGTLLPDELGVVADGRDVHDNLHEAHGVGHHTIYPAVRMQVRHFNVLFMGLGWVYQGRRLPAGHRQAREGARNPGGAGQ